MSKTRRERRVEKFKNKRDSLRAELDKLEIKSNPEVSNKKQKRNVFQKIYEDHYKKLLFIPIILLVLSFVIIGVNIVQTGDFINRGVSLKGGLDLTILPPEHTSIVDFETSLRSEFPGVDLTVRELTELGVQKEISVEADLDPDVNPDGIIHMREFVEGYFGITDESYILNETGSSLGEGFFRQTMVAVLIAFLLMAIVVFAYFRTVVPSSAVVLAAFSDIVITIAILDLWGVKIGTAGIAALLMLIGYSVDTDILLSTRVLKQKQGSVMSRVYSAMKTGLTMNLTTIIAVTIGLIVTSSEVIFQIMAIILIGLLVDIINTWLQNVAILRYYLEKKSDK